MINPGVWLPWNVSRREGSLEQANALEWVMQSRNQSYLAVGFEDSTKRCLQEPLHI
jgi:hypothetical protein